LTYSKNRFLLIHIKKNETYYKNLKNDDIIIKNDIIDKIESLKINDEGLIYFSDKKLKQTKITDYKSNRKNYKSIEKKDKNVDLK
jgi:hypothetical protein